MSGNTVLVIVGALLLVFGIAKSSGVSLSNIGINFGSTNIQQIKARDIGKSAEDARKKPDLIGLLIAIVGLITAMIGLFKT